MIDSRKAAVIPSDVHGWIRTPASIWGESENRVRAESSSSRVLARDTVTGVLLRDRASQQVLALEGGTGLQMRKKRKIINVDKRQRREGDLSFGGIWLPRTSPLIKCIPGRG